ncbi:MAG: hypothetical protein K8T20_01575, partial [Planctomycetes bacterium]|nr:hypothetical protein [Planctomycetota bacterium]
MKAAALLLALAAAASAQPSSADLANPTKLGDRKEYAPEGISIQPPEGCVTMSSDGPDGQRVIMASRVVRAGGQDEPMGIQVEVIGDLDLTTYRRIMEGLQGARGLAAVTVDNANRNGHSAWRADLTARQGEAPTHLVAIDAGDRLVVVSWAPREATAREFGALLEEAVNSVKVEFREPAATADLPPETWSPEKSGVTLKSPSGWKATDRGEARALKNPRDRFENLAFGLMDGTAREKADQWEALRRDRTASSTCVEAKEETYLGRKSFVCVSRLVHQGVAVLSETRLVEHRGRLVFV